MLFSTFNKMKSSIQFASDLSWKLRRMYKFGTLNKIIKRLSKCYAKKIGI